MRPPAFCNGLDCTRATTTLFTPDNPPHIPPTHLHNIYIKSLSCQCISSSGINGNGISGSGISSSSRRLYGNTYSPGQCLLTLLLLWRQLFRANRRVQFNEPPTRRCDVQVRVTCTQQSKELQAYNIYLLLNMYYIPVCTHVCGVREFACVHLVYELQNILYNRYLCFIST